MFKIETSNPRSSYNVKIGSGSLDEAGVFFRARFGRECRRLAIVSNRTVSGFYGDRLDASLRRSGFKTVLFEMGEGERFKTLRTAEKALEFMSANEITRSDAIVALGGGVVGDLAGFVAGIYLRGVTYLQIPTTIVSMVDSSVGGKAGVNTPAGKNTVGVFHHPGGVLMDPDVLTTLPRRELTSGTLEMIKHAVLSGTALFDRTSSLLPLDPLAAGSNELTDLLVENISFKARIVSCDEREDAGDRSDTSRKILNLGHTLGHALEKTTNYRYFRHGEAVGYGILFVAEISNYLALLDRKCVNSLYDVVHRAGALPSLDDIDEKKVFEAFRSDKKNIGGNLQWVLLKDIGQPVIVDNCDIPKAAFRHAYRKLLKNLI